MKKSILAMAALVFMAWGCSTSDDDEQSPVTPEQSEVSGKKNTTTIEPGDAVRPNWQVPDYNLYEQTMSVDVILQQELVQYVSDQDLLCATIDGEVRGVAAPIQDESNAQWIFPITVGSNDANVAVSLSYYCDKLHRIFTVNWTTFDANIPPSGTGNGYTPRFVE